MTHICPLTHGTVTIKNDELGAHRHHDSTVFFGQWMGWSDGTESG
jgi:hypothetical protein